MRVIELPPEEQKKQKQFLKDLRVGLEGYIGQHPSEIAPRFIYELSEHPQAFMDFYKRQESAPPGMIKFNAEITGILQAAAKRPFLKEFSTQQHLTRRELFAVYGPALGAATLAVTGAGTTVGSLAYITKEDIINWISPDANNKHYAEHLGVGLVSLILGFGGLAVAGHWQELAETNRIKNYQRKGQHEKIHEEKAQKGLLDKDRAETMLHDLEQPLQEKLKALGITPLVETLDLPAPGASR